MSFFNDKEYFFIINIAKTNDINMLYIDSGANTRKSYFNVIIKNYMYLNISNEKISFPIFMGANITQTGMY